MENQNFRRQESRQSQDMDGRVKLVQIANRRDQPLPALSERQIFGRKLYVGLRKFAGFLYTRQAYGTFRRWLFSTFLPERILTRWRPFRQGECNRCGMCCKIVLRCPFLHEADQQTACLIYTSTRHVPPPCLSYPFDPADLADVQRAIAPAICPFTFTGEPEYPTTAGAVWAELRAGMARQAARLRQTLNF